MSLVPITYRLRRLMDPFHRHGEAVEETVVVSPSETQMREAAVYLPDQTERVRATHVMSTRDYEWARISEGLVEHAPTLAIRVKDAVILEGTVFGGGVIRQMASTRAPRLPRRARRVITETVSLIGTPVSDRYFGHYAVDDAGTALLALDFGPVHTPASRNRPNWPHATGYYDKLKLQPAILDNARLRDVWLFQDHGMTANRRGRIEELRRRLSVTQPGRSGAHGVMILRGASGQQLRFLDNENELAEALSRREFTIVDPTRDSIDTIISKVSGASVVVGVEGSALAHAILLMADRAALVALQPPFAFNNVWKDFTDLLGMTYGFVVGQGSDTSFRVDIDEVLQTISLAVDRAQSRVG